MSGSYKDINPVPVLVAIVFLCTVYGTVILILDITGHENLASGFTGVFLPIIMALLALKVDMIRRRTESHMNTMRDDLDRKWDGRTSDISSSADRTVCEFREWLKQHYPENSGGLGKEDQGK